MSEKKIKMIPTHDDSVFMNSKSVFVEYIDLIRSPYFYILRGIANSKMSNINSVFDLSKIQGKSDIELIEYYYHRRHQNPLYDLAKPGADYDKLDKIMDGTIERDGELLMYSPELNMVDAITILMHTDSLLVKKVFIYYPYENQNIRSDVNTLFGFNENIEFVTGDLDEVLKAVPEDSTYVFSDIMKIETLAKLEKLNLSSIVLPYEYGYNYEHPGDIGGNLLLDLDKFRDTSLFKIDFFIASIKNTDSGE